MKLLKYVTTSDSGLALNPYFAICSLAMCAPNVLLRICWICLSTEAVDLPHAMRGHRTKMSNGR
ncbi:hypothetical protein [Burkholderia ubonensis]|uniref:hypothetical protein n=1 Tax=Burkholderia ubonensis TaxID=101571 RepID=UPI000B11B8D6|nr:hypothetical protein [Burkholderia ubonensis]